MSRFILAVVVLMLVVTVAGCNRFPDLSIQVTANLSPDDECVVSSDSTDTLPSGRYDLAVVRDYVMWPRVESYIVSNALEFQGEQGNIQITGFDVTILLPDGSQPVLAGELPNPYSVASSAVIPESGGGEPSASAAFAVAIPASYHSALLALVADTGFEQISIDIRANGTTSGGFSQKSGPFRWPLLFCNGCLGVACDAPAEVGDPELGACYPGQDNDGYCVTIVEPEIPAPT